MKYLLIILALAAITQSCNPVKKAVKTFKEHPDKAAEFCAENFGCPTVSVDSSAWVKGKQELDSMLAVIEAHRIEDSINDASDLEAIDRLRLDSMTACDSVYETLYRYASDQKKEKEYYQVKYKEASSAARNLKPIEIKTIDSALMRTYKERALKAEGEAYKAKLGEEKFKELFENEIKKNKGKLVIRIPWLWIIIASVLFSLYLFLKLKGIALNPLKWFGKT